MMIIMHPGASKEQIQNVIAEIEKQKLSAHLIEGVEQTIIGRSVTDIMSPRKSSKPCWASSWFSVFHNHTNLPRANFTNRILFFNLTAFPLGARKFQSLQVHARSSSRAQILETAEAVKEAGANALRGGVFKPRTSPYAFQGLGEEGTRISG